MPKKSYSYIETKDIKTINIEKKTIEHLSPSPLPVYNPLNVYKKDDKFQDSNGVEYTTVNTNQKFLVLAKTYNSVIKGQNVVVTAYMDPEWFDGKCHLNYKRIQSNPEFRGCNDSDGFIIRTFSSNELISPINILNGYPSSFIPALQLLNSNIANLNNDKKYGVSDFIDSNPNDDKGITYETGIMYGPISLMVEDFDISKGSTAMDYIKPRGIYIIFKTGYTPPYTIQLTNSFSTLLYNSSSSYFSYFFRKLGSNPPDNFTSLTSQSNIDKEWNEYQTNYRDMGNKMAAQCCSVM
jgi:hypothetical protein